jgi:hypothetical protein
MSRFYNRHIFAEMLKKTDRLATAISLEMVNAVQSGWRAITVVRYPNTVCNP